MKVESVKVKVALAKDCGEKRANEEANNVEKRPGVHLDLDLDLNLNLNLNLYLYLNQILQV